MVMIDESNSFNIFVVVVTYPVMMYEGIDAVDTNDRESAIQHERDGKPHFDGQEQLQYYGCLLKRSIDHQIPIDIGMDQEE
jgi:hypothetical protein